MRSGKNDFQTFRRTEHRNRRSDHAFAAQHRGPDQYNDDRSRNLLFGFPMLEPTEREQGKDAAFTLIMSPHDHRGVFDAHHTDQCPKNQRQYAIDCACSLGLR